MENARVLNNHIDYSGTTITITLDSKPSSAPTSSDLNGEIAERPQHMLLRVSVGIHSRQHPKALETYDLMSPRLLHPRNTNIVQFRNTDASNVVLLSCLPCKMIHFDGIYDTLKQCALISKSAGGIGLSIHHIRSKGSYIKGTNGTSPTVSSQCFESSTIPHATSTKAAASVRVQSPVYLEPWHPDILRIPRPSSKNHGKEELRARDLFYALWTPDSLHGTR